MPLITQSLAFGVALFCLLTTRAPADDSTYPGWPGALEDIPPSPHESVEVSLTFGHYLLSVRGPHEDGIGCSGGPTVLVTLRDKASGKTLKFRPQFLGGRVLEDFNGYPQFEIWARSSCSTWSRSLYQVEHGVYTCTRVDDFYPDPYQAMGNRISTTLPSSDDTIYYGGTHYPEAQQP